jgi:hypothetical protein
MIRWIILSKSCLPCPQTGFKHFLTNYKAAIFLSILPPDKKPNMRKYFFVLTLFTALATISFAQGAKSVYFELGGPGLASFNFDTRFGPKEAGFGGRIGVGGFKIDEVGVIFIPVGLNYLLGKDGRNYFEIGAGATPVILSEGDSDSDFAETFGWLNFGYRMQPAEGGFTFRAFITPVFGNGVFIPYYGGVSFGYKFGSGKRAE